ncbi:MAG TPA: substrate import-associated zinc metallohydrolase lipoprotein [Ohtaekwangia sp.]
MTPMNTRIKSYLTSVLIALLLWPVLSCSEDDVNKPIKENPTSDDPLDIYIQENFTDKYGVAVRYTYVDRYVEAGKRVTPPERDLVIPMLDFLTEYWIEPFINVPNGRKFFEDFVPAEMVFIGSFIYNPDGTVTLGTADAGARITLTEVNNIDPSDQQWVFRQLGTIYHEFAHIVHQNFNLPPNWQTISPEGYTSSGSWYTLSNAEALERGFVSPYATSSFNEDFAETVAFLLFHPDFYDIYINDEPGCTTSDCDRRNEGRAKLRQKYNAVLAHYKQHTKVDLLEVRELIQEKF